jgi:ribonucleoside-diphosphate reductase alpha chain
VQAAFQASIDNSVSKTINLRAAATRAEMAGVFRSAWELGLKGVTVFRYGSRRTQVLEFGTGETAMEYDQSSPCERPECRLSEESFDDLTDSGATISDRAASTFGWCD